MGEIQNFGDKVRDHKAGAYRPQGSLDHDLGIQTHPPGSPETQFTAEYNGGGHQNMYQGDL
jgi:hypothetical protein